MLRATRSVPVGASSARAAAMLPVIAITCDVQVAAWHARQYALGAPGAHGYREATAGVSSAHYKSRRPLIRTRMITTGCTEPYGGPGLCTSTQNMGSLPVSAAIAATPCCTAALSGVIAPSQGGYTMPLRWAWRWRLSERKSLVYSVVAVASGGTARGESGPASGPSALGSPKQKTRSPRAGRFYNCRITPPARCRRRC